MEYVQPYQVLIPFGLALVLGIVLLIWSERPRLYAQIRACFQESARGRVDPTTEPVPNDCVIADTDAIALPSEPTHEEPDESAHDIISRRMSNTDLIVLLAVQRKTIGSASYRWTANEIAAFIKGTRADVLRVIREARGVPQPVFRPLTDEQRQLRQDMGLDPAPPEV